MGEELGLEPDWPQHEVGYLKLSNRELRFGRDLKADGWMSEPPRVATRDQVLATVPLAGNGPIRVPSLEVVNVARDSAVGPDCFQSAPNL
jgi:hypothetical protein